LKNLQLKERFLRGFQSHNQSKLKLKVYISVDFLLISDIIKTSSTKDVVTYGVFNNNRFRTASPHPQRRNNP
jgi:hypothetical protein